MDTPHAEIILVQELVVRLNTILMDHLAQRRLEKQRWRTKYPDLQGHPSVEDHDVPDFVSGGLFRVLGRLESHDPIKGIAVVAPVLDPDAETVAPMSDQVIAIVLTNDDDDNDVGTYFPPAKITPPLQRQLLQVDTRLLGNEWKLQLKSTYEFTGEARWESTQGYQQQPSWRLQARMARIMDGVDLYTYIRSVHLMRQFVTSNIR